MADARQHDVGRQKTSRAVGPLREEASENRSVCPTRRMALAQQGVRFLMVSAEHEGQQGSGHPLGGRCRDR
nr:MAG TPA: hypothetical protein [Caudoviricetes sp.]